MYSEQVSDFFVWFKVTALPLVQVLFFLFLACKKQRVGVNQKALYSCCVGKSGLKRESYQSYFSSFYTLFTNVLWHCSAIVDVLLFFTQL